MHRDTEKLASQFLSLWQKQLASMMKEPDSAASAMQAFFAAQKDYLNRQFYHNTDDNRKTDPSDSALSQYGNAEIDELARRIAICEERIAALESGNKRRSERIVAKDKKRKRARISKSRFKRGHK